ncbi:hypothetical protein U91I_03853 [alpha proteobacterium U9-1i]|nr:hypothetical protein U91I_03853 [alpha proteobacterium U9-1i]
MNLPALHQFEIQSPLSAEDALARISAHVIPIKYFRPRMAIGFFLIHADTGRDRFEGQVFGNRFDVRRLINYVNVFAPRSEGVVRSDGARSQIRIRMMLPDVVIAVAAVLTLVLLVGAFSSDAPPEAYGLVVLIAIAAIFVVLLGFWIEASLQEAVFREIFRA